MTTSDPFSDIDEVPRRVMTLFYLVDTSGSMDGTKIAALNVAVRETLPILEGISQENSDALIKIAVLEFSSGCAWMYPKPVDVKNFQWRDLQANGLTSMGEAYEELSSKLSKSHGFMQDASGSFAPVILLLSDGEPTDDANRGLQKLKGNNWFVAATKVAIAIGNDANKQTLIDFTGNEEAVLTVHTIDELKRIIRLVSVTASRISSKSTSAGQDAPNKTKETVDAIGKSIADDQTLKGVDVGDSVQNSNKTDDWEGW